MTIPVTRSWPRGSWRRSTSARCSHPGAARRFLSVGVCQTARIPNDLALGAAMGSAIRASNRRVVLIAAGGMSHRFWDYDNVLQHASASPDDISSLANRLYDEKLMEWFGFGWP